MAIVLSALESHWFLGREKTWSDLHFKMILAGMWRKKEKVERHVRKMSAEFRWEMVETWIKLVSVERDLRSFLDKSWFGILCQGRGKAKTREWLSVFLYEQLVCNGIIYWDEEIGTNGNRSGWQKSSRLNYLWGDHNHNSLGEEEDGLRTEIDRLFLW